MDAMPCVQPGIRVKSNRDLWQLGEMGKSLQRGLVGTTEGLVRALEIVVSAEASRRFPSLLQCARTILQQAFLFVASVIPFDTSILLWVLRITHLDVDAQARAQTHEGRGKSLRFRAADPARIAIDGDGARMTMRVIALDHTCQRRFSREIAAHVGIEQDGGANIHHIAGFDHMHGLAFRIGWHRRNIFEVDLPMGQGHRTFNGLVMARAVFSDTLMLLENTINGSGARNRQLEQLLQRRTLQPHLFNSTIRN
jgi:hypothetical protein